MKGKTIAINFAILILVMVIETSLQVKIMGQDIEQKIMNVGGPGGPGTMRKMKTGMGMATRNNDKNNYCFPIAMVTAQICCDFPKALDMEKLQKIVNKFYNCTNGKNKEIIKKVMKRIGRSADSDEGDGPDSGENHRVMIQPVLLNVDATVVGEGNNNNEKNPGVDRSQNQNGNRGDSMNSNLPGVGRKLSMLPGGGKMLSMFPGNGKMFNEARKRLSAMTGGDMAGFPKCAMKTPGFRHPCVMDNYFKENNLYSNGEINLEKMKTHVASFGLSSSMEDRMKNALTTCYTKVMGRTKDPKEKECTCPFDALLLVKCTMVELLRTCPERAEKEKVSPCINHFPKLDACDPLTINPITIGDKKCTTGGKGDGQDDE